MGFGIEFSTNHTKFWIVLLPVICSYKAAPKPIWRIFMWLLLQNGRVFLNGGLK